MYEPAYTFNVGCIALAAAYGDEHWNGRLLNARGYTTWATGMAQKTLTVSK